ncbi:DUF3152 domain-containing protein [Streptomyces sp. NPDC048442]|uniref:DUF3152 domain-containing protein n=1 Tax=Streptomyces sp. NPDC048442 TaxID=3154823 RepID=UPI00343AFF89
MGRHSRRGAAPKGADENPGIGRGTDTSRGASGTSSAPSASGAPVAPGSGRRRRGDTGELPRHQGDMGAAARFQPHHLAGGPRPAPPSVPSQPVRGGHPEQREPGGGWGDTGSFGVPGGRGAVGDTGGGRYGDWVGAPSATAAHAPPRIPGPRREFVEAFEGARPQPRTQTQPRMQARDPYEAVTDWDEAEALHKDGDGDSDGADVDSDGTARRARRRRARTVTGVSAATVTAVLAVVVAGHDSGAGAKDSAAPSVGDRRLADGASRDEDRVAPQGSEGEQAPAAPPTYEQRMARKLTMAADQSGPNTFDTVPGTDKAPGKGKKYHYRVDVEKNIGLDGKFFAEAIQKTLNDKRSWAGNGEMTFERISTGDPDFVVTLATPVTTNTWCLKSELETLSKNVSCDSAATERVMINAYRWAGGSPTFGLKLLLPYRQMLINHEVGHRLGHGHQGCVKNGALAPVMMQQTKTLESGDRKCRPNPWVHPGS